MPGPRHIPLYGWTAQQLIIPKGRQAHKQHLQGRLTETQGRALPAHEVGGHTRSI